MGYAKGNAHPKVHYMTMIVLCMANFNKNKVEEAQYMNTKFIQSIYLNLNLICIFNVATLALCSCPKLRCTKEMG